MTALLIAGWVVTAALGLLLLASCLAPLAHERFIEHTRERRAPATPARRVLRPRPTPTLDVRA